jgi:hypothetical protein
MSWEYPRQGLIDLQAVLVEGGLAGTLAVGVGVTQEVKAVVI